MDFKKLNKVYEEYNSNIDLKIEEEVLDYIEKRLIEEKNIIEELIETRKENVNFEKIISLYKEEKQKKSLYKRERNMLKSEDRRYIMVSYITSLGLVLVETNDVLDVLKYFIKAIKSRNVVCISSTDYDRNDLKSMIMEIFKDALNKYELDEDLVNILPYEECYHENFDLVIAEKNDKLKSEINEESKKMYIYEENLFFTDVVKKEMDKLKENGMQVELLKGDYYKNIEKINKEKVYAASIYTNDKDKGHKFINLVHAENVFMNSTLMNSSEVEKTDDIMYVRKNVKYPMY